MALHRVPANAKEPYHLSFEATREDAEEGLTHITSENRGTQQLLTTTLLVSGVYAVINYILDRYDHLRGSLFVCSPAASDHLLAGRFQDVFAFCNPSVAIRKGAPIALASARVLLWLVHQADHWSFVACFNPFSESSANRSIVHFDSLQKAGHSSSQLLRAAQGAVDYVREQLGLAPAKCQQSSASVPQQPDGSNLCGPSVIANVDMVLEDFAKGMVPKWAKKGAYTTDYNPLHPFSVIRGVIVPNLQPCFGGYPHLGILFATVDTIVPGLPWAAAADYDEAHKAELNKLLRANIDISFFAGNIITRSSSRQANSGVSGVSSARDDSAYTPSAAMDEEEDEEAAAVLQELKGVKKRGAAGAAGCNKKGRTKGGASGKENEGPAGDPLSAMKELFADFVPATEYPAEESPPFLVIAQQVQGLVATMVAETRTLVSCVRENTAVTEKMLTSFGAAKSAQEVDDHMQELKQMAKTTLFPQAPYPDKKVVAGFIIVNMGYETFGDWCNQIYDPSGSKTLSLLRSTTKQLMAHFRANIRGKVRQVIVQAFTGFMKAYIQDTSLPAMQQVLQPAKAQELLQNNAYNGNYKYNTKEFLVPLLAVVNFTQGTQLKSFGGGGMPTQVFEAQVAQVDMELYRFISGDKAVAPSAGGGGRRLTQKGDELAELFTTHMKELQSSIEAGTCELEVSGKIQFALESNIKVGTWRRAGGTISKQHLEQLE